MASRSETHTSTRELVRRYVGGDADAGDRLFRDHGLFLRRRAAGRRAVRQLAGRLTIEDLVHETFARVLDSRVLREFEDRGRGSLRKLLATILDRVIADAVRRQGASCRAIAREEPMPAHVEAGATSPTSAARASELIERARGLLSHREWQVWHRADVEGFTPMEIAAALGESDAAIRGVLHRARKRILLALSIAAPGDERGRSGSADAAE